MILTAPSGDVELPLLERLVIGFAVGLVRRVGVLREVGVRQRALRRDARVRIQVQHALQKVDRYKTVTTGQR